MLFEDQVSNIEAPAHNEKVEKDKQPSLDFELGTKLLKHFFVPSELTVAHSSTLKFQMKSLEQAMDQIDFFFLLLDEFDNFNGKLNKVCSYPQSPFVRCFHSKILIWKANELLFVDKSW